MEELIKILEAIGLTSDELARLRVYYRDDIEGLKHYTDYMRVMFDDRREYLD